ncbi:MAG: GntR family transcriptional regulator [Gammaproteobacteria bacterium]|nr:GntR family transcriptional regulator [Gammaproteobacteria bacterium]
MQQDTHLIDDRLPTPLYHQVYLVLRNKILNDDYTRGSLLPGEQETSDMFGVSRITAKRALNELARDGMVVRERGRGTRVVYHSLAQPVEVNVEGVLENLLAMGLETEVKLLSFDYLPANRETAQLLDCNEGQSVQKAVRVRFLEDEPFSHLTTYVPSEVGDSYSREDLAEKPLLALLERSGIKISRAEQTITATLSDAEVSPALGLELGSPTLCIYRVVYDQNNRPVEYIKALYRPDRYQYRMMLTRVGNESDRSWSLTE